MFVRTFSLKSGVTIKAVNITKDNEIPEALTQLGIPHPQRVIVLVGGAGRMRWLDRFPMWKAIRIVARLAEETRSAVIDGGTQSGIMAEMGKQRKRNGFSFPLIGVVFDSLLMKEEPRNILDPNHTHLLLVPGDDWGDESAWISKIATVLAGDQKSITILVNGGDIARTDVQYSLMEDRPAFIMRGTGRMADEIKTQSKIIPVDVSKNADDILEFLKTRLT